MATYNGELMPDIFLPNLTFCSDSIVSNSPDYLDTVTIFIMPDALSGTYNIRMPVEMREYEKGGEVTDSFLTYFYNRVHVRPGQLNFGAIISPLQEEILLWNANFEAKTCTAIVEVNGQEWDLTGLTPSFELHALADTIFTLDLPAEGSPTFEGSITFDFTGTNDPVVLISGTRIELFSLRPQGDISEKLEWLTNVLYGKDGSTQRRCLRSIPRQSFKFQLIAEDEIHQARLDASMFSWAKRTWGLPVWPELVIHTATINADDMSITVDTTNADFRDASLGVIWKSATECEVIQIETVAAGSLTLNNPVQNTYTGLKLIMPCRQAVIQGKIGRKNYITGLAMYELFFGVKDNILLTGYTPAVTYKSLPVITEFTAVDPTQKKSIDGDVQVTDYEVGDFEQFSDSEFNIYLKSHLFYNDTKAEAWDFRKFLHYLYGMQGAVFVPTGKNDINLVAQIGASDTTFTITGIGLSSNFGVNDLCKDIAFVFPGGTQYYREITGITRSGINEIVSIDSSLGLVVDPGDCIICFLDKVCLAKDEVEFIWPRAHENQCKLKWMAVEE